MVKGLMVEKIEGHINGGNAEVRVCMSLVWIVACVQVLRIQTVLRRERV